MIFPNRPAFNSVKPTVQEIFCIIVVDVAKYEKIMPLKSSEKKRSTLFAIILGKVSHVGIKACTQVWTEIKGPFKMK